MNRCEYTVGDQRCHGTATHVALEEGCGVPMRVCSSCAELMFGRVTELVPLDPAPCCDQALEDLLAVCETCGRGLCHRHAERDDRSFVCSTCNPSRIGWRTPRDTPRIVACTHRELGIVVRHRAEDPCPLCMVLADARAIRELEVRPDLSATVPRQQTTTIPIVLDGRLVGSVRATVIATVRATGEGVRS